MGGIGSVVAILFGIFWTVSASSMGAPGFFPLFGVLFIILGIAQAVYHFKNAAGDNRFSAFDITDDGEEPDPLDAHFRQNDESKTKVETGEFCPYCGCKVKEDYQFCRQCGKNISQ